MTVTIVDAARPVTGGVDTHLDLNVAAALDGIGGPDADFVCAGRQLTAGAAFMRAQGFVHFDAHFENVLTDGVQVYFADFGLATCDRFSLSEAERRFLDGHRDYDVAYVAAGLAACAVNAVRGDRPHREFLRSWIAGDVDRTTLAPQLAALVDRYAPLAVLVLDFHTALDQGPKTHPWPTAEVARLLSTLGDRVSARAQPGRLPLASGRTVSQPPIKTLSHGRMRPACWLAQMRRRHRSCNPQP